MPIKLFAGSASTYIGEEIAREFNAPLGQYKLHTFSDGEFQPAYEDSVRGAAVFIIQSTFQPVDNLFELLMLIDAAKRASANRVIAVIPYFGFARQDRKDKPRTAIGAKLVANLLTAAGVDRIMTLDLHADQIQGFFDVPVDHLYASPIFVPYLKDLNLPNMVIAAPDMGGTKRANAYARFLNKEMVICYKSRRIANEIDDYKVIGDVKGKDVIIVDDMIDTAGTVTIAASIMDKEGASSIRVIATHGVLSGPAIDRIMKSPITEVIVTNSIPQKHNCPKVKVLSIASLFSQVIQKVYTFQSISSHFLVK